MADLTGGYADGIGAMRWVASLCRRDQAPSDDMAITETLTLIAKPHCNIQPAYLSTFYQSTQVETPVTHIITMRWAYYPGTIEVAICSTNLPDGNMRSELFRVRRAKELMGRKRYIVLECELERSRITPDDTMATYNALLTEPYDGAAAAPPQIELTRGTT